jgi:tellurite resistance protein
MSFDASALLKDFDGDRLAALIEAMLLAADADGEFTSDERKELTDSIRGLAKGTEHAAALEGDKLGVLIDAALAELAAQGRDKRIEAVKARLGDADARKAALGLAISVAAADGIVRTSERELIFDLAAGLDIDPDAAADLVKQITRPA